MRLTAPTRAVVDLATIDLADPDLFASGEPHAAWHALRERSPVHWQPVRDGLGFWAVTRYSDVERVLRDHETFTSERGTLLSVLGKPEPASRQQFASTDPPRHGTIRGPVQRAMGMRSVRQHATAIGDRVGELLSAGDGGEPFDFAAVTAELPMLMLGPLLGLPTGDWPWLSRVVGMATIEEDPDVQLPEGPAATLQRAHRELFAYLLGLVVERRRRPGDDLISILLGMRVDGAPHRPGAVVANCYSLVLGASAAIPHVPNAALLELVRTNRYGAWARRPDLLDSGIEEAVRWASPASHFMRHSTRDVRLSGVDIPAGDAVVAWIGSANRDERMFVDPHAFDPARSPNRHLGFGAGHHYCIGAAIGRLTLRVFFAELFRRFAGFTLAGEVSHVRSTWLSGIKRLPVAGVPRLGSSAGQPA